MGVWHKFDQINTMAQKGEKASNDSIRHTKARPPAVAPKRTAPPRLSPVKGR